MKIGSLVFATDQGLGILAKAFYDHGIVTDVMVVCHGRRPEHDEWYSDSRRINGRDDLTLMRAFVRSIDAMLFFETPFRWDLLADCKRSFLMPMYECMPSVLPAQPDRFICPSLLDLRYFPDRSEFIPIPVETSWRLRERARVFVLNAGHGGLKGRNGTGELLDAMRLVKSPIKLILRSQERLRWGVDNPRIDYRVGNFPSSSLYEEGDVFVFPEKFNGLSLPLQEAHASGMLVMCGDRFPMNTWLPRDPLIPVTGYRRERVSGRCVEFDEAIIRPEDIAATMDAWYDRDISGYSRLGREWANKNSWEVLKPVYLDAIQKALSG